jgi:hypothetical protein
MKEEIIQFIWQSGMFGHYGLKTTCGKNLTILSPGVQNFNAGPDFFNAKIKIGDILWAGNIEIHRQSSDWHKHGHHLDPAYDNVILHVVLEEDSITIDTHGRRILTMILDDPAPMVSFYRKLLADDSWLPCHAHIQRVSPVRLKHWLTLLQGKRLEQKSHYVSSLLYRSRLNWEETLCLVLASAFGLPINSLPFEITLSGIPYELLFQNRENLLKMEAVLFGQAGFLQVDHLTGPYDRALHRNFLSFVRDLRAGPVDLHLWKFLRLRPASFPTLRISQFASLLHKELPLLETVLDIKSLTEAEQVLRVESSSYWDTHYLFGKSSPESRKVMGQQAILNLIINALVPFLFSFGTTMHHEAAISLGNMFLQEAEAESNRIIKKWATFGIIPSGAFESQALIHLYNAYCKQKRCLDCQLGIGFIKNARYEKEKP